VRGFEALGSFSGLAVVLLAAEAVLVGTVVSVFSRA
jgi:hypothetical protein